MFELLGVHHAIDETDIEKTEGLAFDRFDTQLRVILTMASVLLVVLTTAHLENRHFVVTSVGNDSYLDGSTFDQRRTELNRFAFSNCEHLVERDFSANVCRYLFYFQFFADDNFMLLATGFYDRVHC